MIFGRKRPRPVSPAPEISAEAKAALKQADLSVKEAREIAARAQYSAEQLKALGVDETAALFIRLLTAQGGH